MNNNDNIGDFFRNKINNPPDSEKDWLLPDAEIRNKLLNQITNPEPGPNNNSGSIGTVFKGIIAIALLASLGYVFILSQEVKSLKASNILQENQIEKLLASKENISGNTSRQFSISKSKTDFKELNNIEKAKQAEELINLNERIAQLESELKNQEYSIDDLQSKNQALLNNSKASLNGFIKRQEAESKGISQNNISGEKSKSLIDENERLKTQIENKRNENHKLTALVHDFEKQIDVLQDELLHKDLTINNEIQKTGQLIKNDSNLVSEESPENFDSQNEDLEIKQLELEELPEPKHQTSKFLESLSFKNSKLFFGYELGMVNYGLFIKRSFANQSTIAPEYETQRFKINLHGLTIAYSPVKNLWIRSGIRYSKTDFKSNYSLAFLYDEENEYVTSEGDNANELSLNTATNFIESSNQFEMIFDENTEINQSDLIALDAEEFQKVSYLQIPLGIDYSIGGNRLMGLVHLGINYNWIKFNNYSYKADLSFDNSELIFETNPNYENSSSTMSFLGSYIGLGLSFEVIKNIRTQVSLDNNFSFNGKNNLSKRNGTNLRFGLNYQF